MKIAYLDCASGISGDMMLGALVDAGVPLEALQAGIDSLGLPSAKLVESEVKKRGFRATQIVVEHEPEHAHRHLHHIDAMIEQSALDPATQDLAKQIFRHLGEAEAKVHGTTIEKVHFHEVGAVDSIADIVGAAIGIRTLGIERWFASPVPPGSGFVEIAHGRCAIPAPATAELLRDLPLAESPSEGELTTPTGAAILKTIVEQFGPLPALTVEAIGYGAGQMDPPQPNVLRLLVGTAGDAQGNLGSTSSSAPLHEAITLLETNIDDCSGEQISYAVETLLASGALDVATFAIMMKKGRPAVALQVQSAPQDADRLAEILLRETTTLGVRRTTTQRTVLPRRTANRETCYGLVEGTIATLVDGSTRFAPEYESCRVAARKHKVPLAQVYKAAREAGL